jgi:carboxylesterase
LGCVLVHGFTATPDEVRPLGDALSAVGFPCRAVRLPGHATSVADLATTRRDEWITTVEAAVRTMALQAPRVALAGVSMGALISLAVAGGGRVPIEALTLLGTPLRFADERTAMLRFVAWIPGVAGPARVVRKRHGRDILDEGARARSRAYDTIPLAAVVELLRLRASVKRLLPRITHPTLVLHGRHDRTAPVANVEELRRRLPARPLEVEIFERSAHVLTEDAERNAVAARIVDFLSRVESQPR